MKTDLTELVGGNCDSQLTRFLPGSPRWTSHWHPVTLFNVLTSSSYTYPTFNDLIAGI